MKRYTTMRNISFVFLNYGPPNLLESAIQSFLLQHPNATPTTQLIIVDNYTSDENRSALKSIVNKHPHISIHLIFNSCNIGYGAGNNIGLKFSFDTLKSDLTFVLNTDILFEKFSSDTFFETITPEPMLYTFNVIENGTNISYNSFSKHTFRSKPSDIRAKNSYPSGCCWGMNRSMWDVSNGFVEDYFLYFEELEFIYRYRKQSKKFPPLTKIEKVTINHSQGGTTGISRDVRSRSLTSEFWSARSRIMFAKNHTAMLLPTAIAYNILLAVHRLAKKSPRHANTILRATFSALFNKSTSAPQNTTNIESPIIRNLP